MSTQATAWPSGLYEAGGAVPVQSRVETPSGGSLAAPVLENGAAIVFTTVFAVQAAAVVAGIGFILASLVALSW